MYIYIHIYIYLYIYHSLYIYLYLYIYIYRYKYKYVSIALSIFFPLNLSQSFWLQISGLESLETDLESCDSEITPRAKVSGHWFGEFHGELPGFTWLMVNGVMINNC